MSAPSATDAESFAKGLSLASALLLRLYSRLVNSTVDAGIWLYTLSQTDASSSLSFPTVMLCIQMGFLHHTSAALSAALIAPPHLTYYSSLERCELKKSCSQTQCIFFRKHKDLAVGMHQPRKPNIGIITTLTTQSLFKGSVLKQACCTFSVWFIIWHNEDQAVWSRSQFCNDPVHCNTSFTTRKKVCTLRQVSYLS